jgi:hypothetical protein
MTPVIRETDRFGVEFMNRATLALISGIAIAGGVHASSAVSFTPGINLNNGVSWSLGWSFTANENINVTHLGFYDDLGDGLQQNHEVGIFNLETQELLMFGTVTGADPLSNAFWRYTSGISGNTQLVAGGRYAIAATTLSANYTFDVSDFVVAPQITYTGDRFVGSPLGVLLFPVNGNSAATGYFGPNFQFDGGGVVPGPAAGLAFMSGLIARRRRNSRK